MKIVLTSILVALVLIFILIEIYQGIASKVIRINDNPTNVDSYIGKTGKICEDVSDIKNGKILINGTCWQARSDEEIMVDEEAIVERIEGNKLFVRKKK